jgi:hypothetical protein
MGNDSLRAVSAKDGAQLLRAGHLLQTDTPQADSGSAPG